MKYLSSHSSLDTPISWLKVGIKQARMATAGNKQPNFSTKKKSQTTDQVHVLNIQSIFYD